MNDGLRQILKQLVASHGYPLTDNPQLCKSLLLDTFKGEYKREINLLMNALDENIHIDLLNMPIDVPYQLLRIRLLKRLQENRGLTEELACWAVDSWALALSIEGTNFADVQHVEASKETRKTPSLMELPGGQISARPLHFIWILDCSSSMKGDKIQSLNTFVRECIPEMRREAMYNPGAQVLIRAVKFSSGASWHIAQPTPLETFQWVDVTAGGKRDMGEALFNVAEELDVEKIEPRSLPPVLVLISDGHPSDNFEFGLKALMAQPWGKRSVRLAIGIGADAPYEMLQQFIGDPEIQPLQANNPDSIVKYIRWPDSTTTLSASMPNSDLTAQRNTSIVIPPPLPTTGFENDIW